MFGHYRVLNEIFLSQSALIHNHHYYQAQNPQAKIAPVLKANAYGHGFKPIANLIEAGGLNPPYTCVDSLYEAYELTKLSYRHPILIMGYTFPDNFKVLKPLPYAFSVYDLDSLKVLNKYQPHAKIHLKIDTGMHRLGIVPSDIPQFIHALKQIKSLQIEGIFTHLSQADDPRALSFTQKQISTFKSAIRAFESHGIHFSYKHLSATAGASYIHDPEFNLIRLGIGLYGISPHSAHSLHGRTERQNLKPVLTFSSHLAQIKIVPPGSKISYGGTYITKHHTQVGVLPLGYNEGVPIALSNRGVVSLDDGTLCPIIGRVCMNMTLVKIPRTIIPKVGDKVTIISPDASSKTSLYNLADLCHTIPYEILTGIHPTIKRSLKE